MTGAEPDPWAEEPERPSALSQPGPKSSLRNHSELSEELPRLRPLTATQFLALDLPPRKMLLDPWLPEKGLAMMYAPRGVGKTLLAMTCAYALARGSNFLG